MANMSNKGPNPRSSQVTYDHLIL